MPPAAHGLSSSLQLQTKERRHLHSIKKKRKPKGKQKGEYEAEGMIFFFFSPFPFFYSSCALPVPVRAAGNCYRQIECLPVSVSGSFADSMNHAKEGQAREGESKRMTNSAELWLYH